MLLVDASVYIFRAFHALPERMTGPDGAPVNAVYGFADFLCGLLGAARPARVAVAFDESLDSSFRNEFYTDYKANREPAPPALEAQFMACRALVGHLGIVALTSPRFEADDLIGTLAARARAAGEPVTIVTSDKDLAQLLGPGDILWDYARDRRFDAAAIRARFGVACAAMPDYLALVGDPVDNIPGVPGVGAKGAAALLDAFGDLDGVYAALDRVPALPMRGATRLAERLESGRDSAYLSRRLARIVADAPLSAEADDPAWRSVDAEAVAGWCRQLGFGDRLRRRLTDLGRPQ